jgi:hypothetical protein
MLTKYGQKRETNMQKRAIRKIMMGIAPFKRSNGRRSNWIRIIFKKQNTQQGKGTQEEKWRKTKKPSDKYNVKMNIEELGKTWSRIRIRKKYWTMYIVFEKPLDMGKLIQN